MALDDDVDRLAQAIRRLEQTVEAKDRALVSLQAQLDALINLMVGREMLSAGHRRHLDTVAGRAEAGPRRSVRLREYIDKYDMNHGEFVDCADRIPICKARCCRFTVLLSQQDLEEGKVRWDLENPYVLLRDTGDGRCVYQDRGTGFCGNYEHRPAQCRQYSCKDDKRIWLDFEKKIIAPLPLDAEPGDAIPGPGDPS